MNRGQRRCKRRHRRPDADHCDGINVRGRHRHDEGDHPQHPGANSDGIRHHRRRTGGQRPATATLQRRPEDGAEEWPQDLLDYTETRKVHRSTAMVLLRARLTGVACKWLDQSVPPERTSKKPSAASANVFVRAIGRTQNSWQSSGTGDRPPDEPVGT